MKQLKSDVVMGLCLSLVFGFAPTVFAVEHQCNVSGQPGILIDPGTAGEQSCRMTYDPDVVPPLVRVYCGASLVPLYEMETLLLSQDQVSLVERGGGQIGMGTACGNTFLNTASYGDSLGSVNGILTDVDGDGTPDAVLMHSNHPETPAVLMDTPLEFSDSAWILPRLLTYAPGLQVDIGNTYQIPINVAEQSLYIECDGLGRLAQIDNFTGAGADGQCAGGTQVIPTASFPGYAALALLLLFIGVWAMRRTGVGKGLGLD